MTIQEADDRRMARLYAERRIGKLKQIQKVSPPTSEEWIQAHNEIRALVLAAYGTDIDR